MNFIILFIKSNWRFLGIFVFILVLFFWLRKEFFSKDFVKVKGYGLPDLTAQGADGVVQELIKGINGHNVFLVGYGTFEKVIENTIKGLTPSDWALVHNTFGKRPYFNAFGKVYPPKSSLFGFPPLRSLNQILQYELSKSDPVYKDVKSLYSAIGINFS